MARTVFFPDRTWTNWHLTVRDVPIEGRFELHNQDGGASVEGLRRSAAAVQALLGRAFAERRRLRTQGTAWSLSEAAAGPGGWMLNTGFANWLFPLPASHVTAGFPGDRDGMVLCQTGISVSELNMFLERRGRSLRTTGASNGQTFVGAMSTGTHGSVIDQPGIQGQVAALQLIPGPDRNLWIEPARRPATDGRLAAELGAKVVRDDRLFDAALVGLGALGVVHSILVETVPRFLLVTNRERVPLTDGIRRAMTGGGFDGATLPGPADRPYFFQSVVNDHIDRGQAYVTVAHKQPWNPEHDLSYDLVNKRGVGYNLGVVVANLVTAFPGLTPPITKAVLSDQLSPIRNRVASWGQSFNFSTPKAGTLGSSIAVPVERTFDALAALQRAYDAEGPAPAAFACRYAVKSPGLLAFIRYPRTAIVDIDGLNSRATRAVMTRAIANLEADGIPHAEHWGKMNRMTAASVQRAYGADLNAWRAARDAVLDDRGAFVFGSAFLDRLGLTSAAA